MGQKTENTALVWGQKGTTTVRNMWVYVCVFMGVGSLNIVFIVCKTKLNRGESALSLGKKNSQ